MGKHLIFVVGLLLYGQAVAGQVNDRVTLVSMADGTPLWGAVVRSSMTGSVQNTDKDGRFHVSTERRDTLVISYVGFRSDTLVVFPGGVLPDRIRLRPSGDQLEEVVVNTGYYELPRERMTGSFAHVDQTLFDRAVSTNVLERLEGVVSGLQFLNPQGTAASDIRIRGVATIESDAAPLIIVDNFPFEGDINSLNPHDVESVTVLRDAAAASIWGARAGNGVIVINMKKGKYGQKATLGTSASFRFVDRPDLLASPKWIAVTDVMEIERQKYLQGDYPDDARTPLPLYVDLLYRRDKGQLSDQDFAMEEATLRSGDIRRDAMKYLYRRGLQEQYAFNLNGGADNYKYYVSLGHDRTLSSSVGNRDSRLNLNMQNTYRPLKGLEMTAGLWFTNASGKNNGLSISALNPKSGTNVSPYLRLADAGGNALAIPMDYSRAYLEQSAGTDLLDWSFRPLEEPALRDHRSGKNEFRANGALNYRMPFGLAIGLTYQYLQSSGFSSRHYRADSYYARDLVNRFTQSNGSRIVPLGGVFRHEGGSTVYSHAGRVQLHYDRRFGPDHEVVVLGGSEIRDVLDRRDPGFQLLGYDEELLGGSTLYNYQQSYPVRPVGNARIPPLPVGLGEFVDRYLSYFGNGSYVYRGRYQVTGSSRWDASNLFGVKTNQKGKALWSLGMGWELSREPFFDLPAVSYLRIRTSYGSSGNVNKSVTHYPVAVFDAEHGTTGLPTGSLRSVGNPSVRWEEIRTLNIGIDFRSFGNRLAGSLEYYRKHARDLIGDDYLDPTVGISSTTGSYKINYADMEAQGIDLQLQAENQWGGFQHRVTALFSYSTNRITHYNTKDVLAISRYTANTPPPAIGISRDAIYGLPWYGLDGQTGFPLIYMDGERSTDYRVYYEQYLRPDNLVLAGVSVPPYFGSLRNTFSYKSFQLGVLVTWKAGHVYRRSSIASAQEYSGVYHADYYRRWSQPGDEEHTSVPAYAPFSDFSWQRNAAYLESTALIEQGALVRLQDMDFSYEVPLRGSHLRNIRLGAYIRDLGLLWSRNSRGEDPDYVHSAYPVRTTYALKLMVGL